MVYNPNNHNVEVYANSGGALTEDFWSSTSGWSGWINLDGAITGNPVTVYNPDNHNVEVYARGSDGGLWERFWSPTGGWSAWNPLGGAIS